MHAVSGQLNRTGRLLACLLFLVFIAVTGIRAEADEAHGCIFPASSSTYLTEEVIADMPLQVLCYARNEIYARDGRTFESPELQNYFNSQYWYTPLYGTQEFPADILNEYEVYNIELLKAREDLMGGYVLDNPGYSYDTVYSYISSMSPVSSDAYYVDPDTYIFYDSNKRYLSPAELQGLSAQEVCYAKNEIYARRGRIFESLELSDYFGQKNWYWGSVPADRFDPSVFNEFETANIETLNAAENDKVPGGYVLDQSYTYEGIGSYTDCTVYSVQGDDYILPDSNTRFLTDADVYGLSLSSLCYARNEIYARRGYIFQSEELRNYFGLKGWYHGTVPAASFSTSVFNEFELANIELLRQYEYSINPNGYQPG